VDQEKEFMTAKMLPAAPPAPGLLTGLWQPAPCTTEERLQCIEAMGRRIDGYVEYMCQSSSLSGTSVEAKEKAVASFYERMVILERQLGRIHDELQLG
jgi:hypothetical protein